MKPMWTRRLALCLVALGLSAHAAPSAWAADRVENVKFKPGAWSSSKSSKIRGYDGVKYLLDARGGQVMQVLFSVSKGSCYFNVMAPGSDAAVFNGSIDGNEFSQNLSRSGTYTVQVYMMRSAARRNETCKFNISFEIGG